MKRSSEIRLFATHPHKCSYLSDQQATTVFIDPDITMDRHLYSQLADCGFRRNGEHVFKPHCEACQACIATRIPVDDYHPNRTQRRLLRRNSDIQLRWLPDIDDDTIYELYANYIRQRHSDGDMFPPDRQQYQEFLGSPWNTPRYLGFFLSDKPVAVAVMDQLTHGLSAVYTFFDCSLPRSLGTWVILQQIALTSSMQLDYLYLGYWIEQSPKMAYKGDFRPIEVLRDGHWQRLERR